MHFLNVFCFLVFSVCVCVCAGVHVCVFDVLKQFLHKRSIKIKVCTLDYIWLNIYYTESIIVVML